MVGAGIQVSLILYQAARPKVHVEHRILNGIQNSNYIYVTLDRSIIFPSVSYVRHQINKVRFVSLQCFSTLVVHIMILFRCVIRQWKGNFVSFQNLCVFKISDH